MSSFGSHHEQPGNSTSSNSSKSNPNPTTSTEFVDKTASGLCKKITNRSQSLPRHSLIAVVPLEIVEGGIKMQNDETLLESPEAMFDFADALDTPTSSVQWIGFIPGTDTPEKLVQWILRIIASCLRIVERGNINVSYDDKSVETRNIDISYDVESVQKRKIRWEQGVLMLNRMVNSLGPIGLMLYEACAWSNYMLIPSGGSGGNAQTRKDIADRAAEMLRHGLAAARRDNVPVFNLAYAISKILRFRISHAEICKMLGLDQFSGVQIESLSAQLEDLDGEVAFVSISPTSRTEGDPVSTYIYEATRRLENAFPMEFLNPNPLDYNQQYKKFTIPDKIQRTALSAGECPVVFGPVKSSADNLHRCCCC